MRVLKLGWAGARLLFLSPWSPGGTHVDVKPSPDDAWASGRDGAVNLMVDERDAQQRSLQGTHVSPCRHVRVCVLHMCS